MAVDLTKVNYILLNADGSVLAQSMDYYVQQGSTGVDKIFFGGVAAQNTDIGMAVCTLPNGEQTTLQGTWDTCVYEGTTIGGFVFTLGSAETNYNGGLMMALAIFRSSVRLVNYPLYVVINETGLMSDTNTGVTVEEINTYLQYAMSALKINQAILAVDSIALVTDWTVYDNGQIVFDKSTGVFHKKIAASPYHEVFRDFVPYTGANKDVNLGNYAITFGDYGGFNGIKKEDGSDNLLIKTYDGNINLEPDGEVRIWGYKVATQYYVGTVLTSYYTKTESDSRFVQHRSESGNNAYVSVGGTDTLMKVTSNAEGGIMSRNSSGQTKVGDPTDNEHAANKGYVDTNFVKKVNYPSELVAYTRNHGIEGATIISPLSSTNTIVRRDANGRFAVAAPSSSTDAANKAYVDTQIAMAISTVYKYKGTKTVAQLNALTAQEIGDTYNVSDDGTLTEGNLHVLAGDNVVWDGSAWDKLAGTVDLSGYYTKVETDALLALKADITSAVMDADLIVSGGFITEINKNGEYIPVAQNVAVTTIPKVVQSTSQLPATNDGYLYLVLDNGYLYSWQNNAWAQAYQYTSDLLTITEVTVEED